MGCLYIMSDHRHNEKTVRSLMYFAAGFKTLLTNNYITLQNSVISNFYHNYFFLYNYI